MGIQDLLIGHAFAPIETGDARCCRFEADYAVAQGLIQVGGRTYLSGLASDLLADKVRLTRTGTQRTYKPAICAESSQGQFLHKFTRELF